MPQRNWTRPELLQTLRLYMRLPFGRLHRLNPDIIAVAAQIGRTPSAVSMKACNFASLDDAITSTGRSGLSGASSADRALWSEFMTNPESVAAEMEAAYESATGDIAPIESTTGATGSTNATGATGSASAQLTSNVVPLTSPADTEIERLIRTRRVQSFFRATVLTSYDTRCAITGLSEPQLLNASHIIPWSEDVRRRADPTNGICLNALFDRAFDRGLITFDADLRVVVSPHLQDIARNAPLACSLLEAHGRPLSLPARFTPDRDAVAWHCTHIFAG
jgi:putative restriction endonuclease